ncbi:ABC transporter G family member 10 [Capsicum annuum]|uniref:ABC transporter G family member 10 n=1 Tax=Capsicum annuum TaxID=4072 RepID=A0A2G2Z509_CAPAN|nr:ABC transporter G family member 10-like [Capsicum annuum]KAF3677182.1 ABC transporter G family member 10 [Capsicum annuum]KAF3679753.1 ABC transporter G family member 10 [Capsicum annuum]PHT77073.1 ABC transporter G family member 10 [Capsicum annuum]
MELPVTTPDYRDRKKVPYNIETRNLSYALPSLYDEFSWIYCCKNPKKPQKFIIKDVNCEARPGEITAIAGPSGAGKTTLLEILAGKISPTTVIGEVLLNGHPVNAKCFRRISGYVTQEDALFPLLTVEETLMYSALLRLQGGKKEAANRVGVLIKELGLEKVAGARVGGGSNRGISGGERRRVSIGVELVHDPAVILIDEPTSGLDSASALHVISLLQVMVAHQGKTIVLTIHQPGFRILELFDRLVLLSNGCVLHNGSLKYLEERIKFSGLPIPPHINVLEFAIDVTGSIVIQTSETPNIHFHLKDQGEKKESPRKDDEGFKVSNHNDMVEKCPSYSNSHIEEILILGGRFCKNIFRTKQLFATRIIQALAAGFILGSIFMNVDNNLGQVALQTRLGFFAFSLTFLLSTMTEGLPIFLQERTIFMRETSRGAYRVSSYVVANTFVFLPFLLMVGLLYSVPVYWLVGLRRNMDGFLYFSMVVWMVVLMSNSFTACFSALVPNFIMGTSIIAGLMGSFFLFSGYFLSKEKIPSYWIFMHYLSLFKYPFECFLINEYGGKGGKRCLESERGECKLFATDFLRQQDLKESQKWNNLAVMLCFILGYRVLCYLILWCRCYRTRN